MNIHLYLNIYICIFREYVFIQICLIKRNTLRELNLLPIELSQIPDETTILVIKTEQKLTKIYLWLVADYIIHHQTNLTLLKC